ncbi:hypothetical protein ACFFK0_23735 [Paenibacillus chartarius]|uniref:RCK N-terminal domain-containing protein n=1 Tax=Paenibacillus chartarius TaxID=747481 RepID=A0ABV6DRZ5_9BACL
MSFMQVHGQPEEEYILVSAPNQAGKQFLNRLRQQGIPFYAMVNNNYGKKRLEAMGVNHIIKVDTGKQKTWVRPSIPIKRMYLFEDSFTLCCRWIQICRAWSDKEICIVSRRDHARMTYRALGADRMIFINGSEDAELLLQPHLDKLTSVQYSS